LVLPIFPGLTAKYVVSFEAIQDMILYPNSRLKLVLRHGEDQKDIVVSQEELENFKEQLNK
jgi:hypothetical protein